MANGKCQKIRGHDEVLVTARHRPRHILAKIRQLHGLENFDLCLRNSVVKLLTNVVSFDSV